MGSKGRFATNLLTKCFIEVDEIEKSQGVRVDRFGRQIPVNQRQTYVYDSSNELYSEEDKGRVITKAGSLEVPNTTQFRIERERAAQQARTKYLTDFGNKQKPGGRIYLPGDEKSIDTARKNNADSEMISLMKELMNQNKSMSSEIATLKSQIQSRPKILKSPKRIK